MHMISKKDLNSAELETVTTSRSLAIVITANGEVQTHEEATVYVKELDILDYESPRKHASSLVARKALAMKNGYSYEWINGQKPHLIKNGIRDTMQHEELRSYRGSRLVNEFLPPVLILQLQ